MTKILAIDASSGACSVALSHTGDVITRYIKSERDHTRQVLPMVDEVLTEANISLRELDALAFTAGPGSFTGLRIAFGFIQGLAASVNLPVIAVSSLAAAAMGAIREGFCESDVLVTFDARMGEVYWGQYRLDGEGAIRCISREQLSSPKDVVAVSAPHLVAYGPGWHYIDLPHGQVAKTLVDVTPHAQDILPLALAKWSQGDTLAAEQVEPLYLRNEVTWKKRQKIRS